MDMKRLLIGVLASLALAAGLLVYRSASTCSDWQELYKRFTYAEMMKNAPVIHTPEMIEQIIGERPPRCDRPGALTDEDIERFRDEGVGPNEFAGRSRKA